MNTLFASGGSRASLLTSNGGSAPSGGSGESKANVLALSTGIYHLVFPDNINIQHQRIRKE